MLSEIEDKIHARVRQLEGIVRELEEADHKVSLRFVTYADYNNQYPSPEDNEIYVEPSRIGRFFFADDGGVNRLNFAEVHSLASTVAKLADFKWVPYADVEGEHVHLYRGPYEVYITVEAKPPNAGRDRYGFWWTYDWGDGWERWDTVVIIGLSEVTCYVKTDRGEVPGSPDDEFFRRCVPQLIQKGVSPAQDRQYDAVFDKNGKLINLERVV